MQEEEKYEVSLKQRLSNVKEYGFKISNIYSIYLTNTEMLYVYNKLCEMYSPEVYQNIDHNYNHIWLVFNWECLGEFQGDVPDEFLVDIHQLKVDITNILTEFHIEQNKKQVDLSFNDYIHEQHNIDPSNVLRISGHGGVESESNNVL